MFKPIRVLHILSSTTTFIFVSLIFCAFKGTVSYAANNGISISPSIGDVVITENDKSIPLTFEVSNNSDKDQEIGLFVVDFYSVKQGYLPGDFGKLNLKLSESSKKYSLKDFITFDKNEVTLSPKSKAVVGISVENNDKLSPGGHYGAVVAFIKSQEIGNGLENGNVLVDQYLSSLIFLKKLGGEVYDVRLDKTNFTTSLFKLPGSIVSSFSNKGNVHVVPRGLVQIYDPRGKVVYKGSLNLESSTILPELSRDFIVTLGRISTPFLPGKYMLVTKYRYDGKESFSSLTEYFWYIGDFIKIAFPILAFGVLICAIVLIIRGKRQQLKSSI